MAIGIGRFLHCRERCRESRSFSLKRWQRCCGCRAWLGNEPTGERIRVRAQVPRYLSEGGTLPFRKPVRPTAFDGLDDWLRERFFRHGSGWMTISTRSRCAGNALRGRAARRGSPVGLAASSSDSIAPSPVWISSKAKACWSRSSFSELGPKRRAPSCLTIP